METQLAQRNLTGVRVVEADLLALTGDDRVAAMDALASAGEYPLVIVEGAVACTGGLDVRAIAEAVERAGAMRGPCEE